MAVQKRTTYLILVFSVLIFSRSVFLPVVPDRFSITKNNFDTVSEPGFFAEVRNHLAAIVNQQYPPLQADLAKGLLLGINDFSRDYKQTLITTGTIHVVVVSGYNVALVASTVFASSLLWGKKVALVLSLLAIVLYTLLTGAQAPTVRAAIMGSLVFGAQGLGRQKEGLDLLIVAAGLMLLLNPTLLESVSFQLSVLATLGIIIVAPKLEKVIKAPGVVRGDLVNTLAAQSLVLPILFFQFGQVSWIAPLVNVLVLWLVPIATILGFISLFLGLVFMPLGQIIAWVNLIFLGIFTTVIGLFESVPVFAVPAGNWLLVIGFYLFVIGLMHYKKS